MANKRFRRFRKTVRKNITRKTVKKMIFNEKILAIGMFQKI